MIEISYLITRTMRTAVMVVSCALHYIPSQSSCNHEFLLVESCSVEGESVMLIIERAPSNGGIRVISSSGGAARDTITVVRAGEHHEYWRRAGQEPSCKGILRWNHSSPRLLDIAFIAGVASTTFNHYNHYFRQCYWYSRITLAAVARAFPSCSREGATSFSRRLFTMFGSYKPSQVQLLVALHTIGRRDLHSPSLEFERHASRLITPDILRSLAMSTVNSLAQLIFDEPGVDIANRHGDRTVGGIPESSQHTEDR